MIIKYVNSDLELQIIQDDKNNYKDENDLILLWKSFSNPLCNKFWLFNDNDELIGIIRIKDNKIFKIDIVPKLHLFTLNKLQKIIDNNIFKLIDKQEKFIDYFSSELYKLWRGNFYKNQYPISLPKN